MEQIGLTKYRRYNTDIYVLSFDPRKFIVDAVQMAYRTPLSKIFSNWWRNRFYKLVAGINLGFFAYIKSAAPLGLNYKYGGVLFSDTTKDDQFMEIIYKDFKLYVDDVTFLDLIKKYRKPDWASSIGYELVRDGAKCLTKSEKFDHATHPNPRTMIGMKGNYMIWAVAEGRDGDDDVGLTADQQADFMLSIGATTAASCDGGGSSTLAIRYYPEEELQIVNRPSDGIERPLADALLLYCKGEYEIVYNDLSTGAAIDPIIDRTHYIIDTDGHAETNFLWSEIACHCGDPYIPDCLPQRKALQRLRDLGVKIYGKCKVVVDVWYRCPKCNAHLIHLYNTFDDEGNRLHPNKPDPNSLHLKAMASDIHMFVRKTDMDPWYELTSGIVNKLAKESGFNNRGMYNTFTHVGISSIKELEKDNRTN